MSTTPSDRPDSQPEIDKKKKRGLGKLVPSLDALGNFIRESWDRLEGLPGGKRIFSSMVGLAAPYTGSIGAQVVRLEKGRAEVVMKDRRGLRNHLSSLHAIALANLAELAGNVALAYSLPDDARFIVAGMSLEYVKKARGTITATSTCPVPSTAERVEFEVPVELRDERGDVVVRATLKSLVGPKKSR